MGSRNSPGDCDVPLGLGTTDLGLSSLGERRGQGKGNNLIILL